MSLDPWAALRDLTPARVGRRTVGQSPTTADLLEARADQAMARDALRATLDVERLRAELGAVAVVDTMAADHRDHLLRPDLGRRLAPGAELPVTGQPNVVFVLVDGLSADAVNVYGPRFVQAVRAPGDVVVLARRGRVALGDEIGERLGARFVAVCIGERPGLTSPRNLSVYLTMDPVVGRVDAERNCISNIAEPHGLTPEAAARRFAWLVGAATDAGATGVALKDGSGSGELSP